MGFIESFCKVCTILFLVDIVMNKNTEFYKTLIDMCILWITSNQNSYISIYTIKFLYNMNYLYSSMQIFYDHSIADKIQYIKVNAIYLLEKYKLIDKSFTFVIQIYKKNELLDTIQVYDLARTYDLDETVLLYKEKYEQDTLIVISDCSQILLKPTINMMCYYEIPQSLELQLEYELSSIQFLYMTVTYKDIIYNIELLNKQYNFYIVNNIINNQFIFYYLKYILNTEVEFNNNTLYTIDLCDHNATFVTLNQTNIIIIEKEGYRIIPYIERMEDDFILTQ